MVIYIEVVAKALSQHFEMLEFGQSVLDHNTDTRQFSIGQLLIFCQRVITPCLVRDKDAMVGQFMMQALITGITTGSDFLWYVFSRPGLAE